MKAETILAKLYELRRDYEDEPQCEEYLALNHAFCFMSYKINEVQAYLDETSNRAAKSPEDAD